ncbi:MULTISPECIES: hypothetical protein [unclassified Streptomyces]|uniref:hypothetical protein n=1 Tax=unclassified Streptomyces TaxID=2593676 RepID=UPI000B12EF8B|nr:hypothetical protein [Streptomyces sp. TSRI0281]
MFALGRGQATVSDLTANRQVARFVLAPAAAAEVACGLAALDIGEVLGCLPADHLEAAETCGFRGFNGHPHEYLIEHVGLRQSFYLIAGRRGLAVLTWTD